MFKNLKFKMVNSIGMQVEVVLDNHFGIINYRISFPRLGAGDSALLAMSKSNSDRLKKRLENLPLIHLLMHCPEEMGVEEGDFWFLEVLYSDGSFQSLCGGENPQEPVYDQIQDLAEVFDDTFCITQYIRGTRLDGLEIDYERTLMVSGEPLRQLDYISLERSTGNITYSRHHPGDFFSSDFECHCSYFVRRILEQTEAMFTDNSLFRDIPLDDDEPEVGFTFIYHDGSKAFVSRSLSLNGLGDAQYHNLLRILFETFMAVFLKDGVLDQRHMLPEGLRKKCPFSVVYAERPINPEDFRDEDEDDAS